MTPSIPSAPPGADIPAAPPGADIPAAPTGADINVKRRTIGPGEVIFLEGQPGDCAYVILKGEVQAVITDAKGQPLIVNRMPVGELFGEIALLQDHCTRTATTTSEHGCELAILDKSVFDKHLAGADPFLRYVIEHLCRHILNADKLRRQ